MTVHFIAVMEGKWKLRSPLLDLRHYQVDIVGRTSEDILWVCLTMLGSWTKLEQRFVLSLLLVIDPADIHVTDSDQLYTATLDNTGNNNTTCKTIQGIHTHRGLEWNSDEQQLLYILFIHFYSSQLNFIVHSCLGHVVNLGNIDVMGHIMKIATVKKCDSHLGI